MCACMASIRSHVRVYVSKYWQMYLFWASISLWESVRTEIYRAEYAHKCTFNYVFRERTYSPLTRVYLKISLKVDTQRENFVCVCVCTCASKDYLHLCACVCVRVRCKTIFIFTKIIVFYSNKKKCFKIKKKELKFSFVKFYFTSPPPRLLSTPKKTLSANDILSLEHLECFRGVFKI